MDLGLGPIEGSLVGATVDAVWPSTYTPYKMMTPADAKGVAVQDRAAGMVAHLSGSVATFPVTTHGSLDGGATVTDVTDLGDWFATTVLPGARRLLGRLPRDHDVHGGGGPLPRPRQRPARGQRDDDDHGRRRATATDDYTITRDNIWDNDGDDTGHGPRRRGRRRRDDHHGEGPRRPVRRARRAR